MIQDWSDDYREWRMSLSQDVIKRKVAERDFWRREIGKPWIALVPGWVPWAALVALWVGIGWLVLW